jgi:hypothetical protein
MNTTYSAQEIRGIVALLADYGSYERIIEVASLLGQKADAERPETKRARKAKAKPKVEAEASVGDREDIDNSVMAVLRGCSRPTSASDIMKKQTAGLSNAEVSLSLKRLVRAGLVERTGVRRGAKYEAKP